MYKHTCTCKSCVVGTVNCICTCVRCMHHMYMYVYDTVKNDVQITMWQLYIK